jgi:tRNA dimethylallyltransferase
MSFNLITILGPTATGKTQLSVKLANHFNGEIISADSRQVYKYMDIGTGKDINEYTIENKKIKYHLIDILEPTEEFNLYLFKQTFFEAYSTILSRRKIPFLVGGTGLYLSSILLNYKLEKADFGVSQIIKLNDWNINQLQEKLLSLNPRVHNTTDLLNKDRLIRAIAVSMANKDNYFNSSTTISSLTLGIMLSRDEIKKRITLRLNHRLESGLVNEVEALLTKGITFEKLNFFGLEYRYVSLYLMGKLTYEEMFIKLNSSIHNFAKRQMTWFRKMEKEGIDIHWLEGANYEQAVEIINKNYE